MSIEARTLAVASWPWMLWLRGGEHPMADGFHHYRRTIALGIFKPVWPMVWSHKGTIPIIQSIRVDGADQLDGPCPAELFDIDHPLNFARMYARNTWSHQVTRRQFDQIRPPQSTAFNFDYMREAIEVVSDLPLQAVGVLGLAGGITGGA